MTSTTTSTSLKTLTATMKTTTAMTTYIVSVSPISTSAAKTSSQSSSIDVISSSLIITIYLNYLCVFLISFPIYSLKDSGSPIISTTKTSSTKFAQNCAGKFERQCEVF